MPAVAYGRADRVRVRLRDRFAQQLLGSAAIDEWLYNSVDNPFGVRDLGYYVGFAIAEGVVARYEASRPADGARGARVRARSAVRRACCA